MLQSFQGNALNLEIDHAIQTQSHFLALRRI